MLVNLEKAGVNIEYMYAFAFRRADKAIIVFRFEDPDAAIELLAGTGVSVLGDVELYESAEQ